ncbi:hypothetical protein DL764_004133 [Monosporascus ibericus]|uniref:Zn(2)-C6 fungal-type domain-containing protein n=1 Tax=Monosporascus ibericus TaxID=155417 RepID=A0A4Q4TDU7_9PEZI|nr:hypothetical protein DL764_004133 [Monosporascus ibericus]
MSPTTKAQYTRTFTGCRTCRSRHAKCDEAQPVCGTCQRLSLDCGGYSPCLFWITDEVPSSLRQEQQQSHRSPGYRYPLFSGTSGPNSSPPPPADGTDLEADCSELDRRFMSDELSGSLGGCSPLQILAEIDTACEKVEGTGRAMTRLAKGPFGVFPAVEPSPAARPPTPEPTPSFPPSSSNGANARFDPDGLVEEDLQKDWTDRLCDANSDLFVEALDPSLSFNAHEHGSPDRLLMQDASVTHSFFSGGPIEGTVPLFKPNFGSHAMGQGFHVSGSGAPHSSAPQLDIPPTPSPRGPLQELRFSSALPETAEPLLRYYKQYIDGVSNSIQPKRTSPWQLIFLPYGLETFAELSLWNGASQTRSCIFYALLAHSAFHLHLSNKQGIFVSHWRDVAIRHQEKAKYHLRNALQFEMLGEKHAKYTELLMAILAMGMISVSLPLHATLGVRYFLFLIWTEQLYNGAYAFKACLMDAERLIRLRGLPKQKSFKIRILHHMYTHLRVMAESVSVSPDVGNAGNNTGGSLARSDLRTFRIEVNSLNIGLDPAQEKTRDVGYNDIHLEIQGRWKETLYPAIYGIPESLMTLLSQTISLSNEKARLESIARTDSRVSVALGHHVKALEGNIWSWSLPPERAGPERPQQPTSGSDRGDLIDHPQARSMVLAIHSALIIYFYRRVYNMSAMIMQDLVRKTLDHLEHCTDQMVDDPDFSTSLAWPAFIAACEAATPDLQERSLNCLEMAEKPGACFTPKPASMVVATIRQRRQASGEWTISWPDVLMGDAEAT